MDNVYNHSEVVRLIKLAKGNDRTMKEYALQAGICSSTLSSIITGKRKATIKNIQMITSNKARPQNGVTVEQLATACGFVNIVVPPFSSDIILAKTSADASIEDRFNHQRELEIIASGVVQNLLAEKQVSYISSKNNERFYAPSMSVELADGRVWWFEVDSFINIVNTSMNMKVQQILLKIFLIRAAENRTITIVVDTEAAYDFISSLANEIAYKGNLTVVYLNRQKMLVEKEMILSYYSDVIGNELHLL